MKSSMMDVGLLRPGTVPISPDTILWFEFLLNPSLLEKHLSKPSPDPSATDLMIKFMSINSESKDNDIRIIDTETNESRLNIGKKLSHKSVALKILSLKVGAFLKWDLDILEKKLPLPMQLTFLQDLYYITNDVVVEIPNPPDYPVETVTDEFLFAIVLYHRWHIRAIVNRSLNNKQIKQQFIHIPGIQEPTYVSPAYVDDILRKLEINIHNSLEVLNAVLNLKDINPKVLTFDTFQMLNEDTLEIKQNWNNMKSISVDEFKCQIHYDLATFHLLREEYKEAKYHVSQAKTLFSQLGTTDTLLYCRVQKNNLHGYCLATNVQIEGIKPTLTQRLHNSIKEQYANIIDILKEDNITREIPTVYRDNLELDIQGGLVNKKIFVSRDLLLKIQCLNLVRKIIDGDVLQGNYVTELKKANSKGLNYLFDALDNVLPSLTTIHKQRVSRYLMYFMIMTDMPDFPLRLLSNDKYKSLFNDDDLNEIRKQATPDTCDIPDLLLNNNWGVTLVTYTKSHAFNRFELEKKLTLSYDPIEIRDILRKLDGNSSINPLWKTNCRWDLPIPLQSVIMSLPRSFHQDYLYILLAKSRELVILKNFDSARMLLHAIDQEIKHNRLSIKLSIMINWELILVDILDYLNVWPLIECCDIKKLIERCKECLDSLQSTDQPIPRQEIIENCTIFLLNMCEWDYLSGLEKRWSHYEFAAGLSILCQDVVKYKGTRKFSREAWDIVLLAFGPNRDQPQKRTSSSITGSTGSLAKEMLTIITSTLSRLREPTALNVAISLLTRIHNVLRDEQTLEVYSQYLVLWPASIPNANSFPVRTVGEFLLQLLTQALKYYPTNVCWLRVMADLNFVLGYYESAMKYYLEAIIMSTDLFSLPVPRTIQPVFWRMIKCCAHLQCYTQATVLCQFLEEVNYSLAFKMASSDQKSCATADAMDAYYHCIWDTTILEYLINLHSKRGEHHRKQLAIKVIGLLELNSNNNEEIQREAANIRKARFFRALAKQYVY